LRKREIQSHQEEPSYTTKLAFAVLALTAELTEVRQQAREWKMAWANEQARRRELEQQLHKQNED